QPRSLARTPSPYTTLFRSLAEAMSGYAHMTGSPDGPPTLPSFGLADGITGVTGAYAIMVALHERDTMSGAGQSIDLAIYEPLMRSEEHTSELPSRVDLVCR